MNWRQRLELLVPSSVRRALRATLAPLWHVALQGNTVECPICGSTFRRFAAFGSPARVGAQCPRCGSLERHRQMWLFLIRETPVTTAPLRVLHVAPEPGISRRLRALPNLDYLTADLDPTRADVQMDITGIDFPDGHFDVILCSNVLEHVPHAARAMRELCRVLAPSGFALLEVPIHPDLADTYEDWSITTPEGRTLAFGQHNHVRWYGRNYPDYLRAAGFSVVVDPAPLVPGEAARFGLRDEDHIFYCLHARAGSGEATATQ